MRSLASGCHYCWFISPLLSSSSLPCHLALPSGFSSKIHTGSSTWLPGPPLVHTRRGGLGRVSSPSITETLQSMVPSPRVSEVPEVPFSFWSSSLTQVSIGILWGNENAKPHLFLLCSLMLSQLQGLWLDPSDISACQLASFQSFPLPIDGILSDSSA